MIIGGIEIGESSPPFVVAELSGNHNRSLERALAIVDAAADAGAHALKLQTYTADTITLALNEGEFVISDTRSPWCGRSLHELYAEAHTPWDWHPPIMARARARGLVCFSTPFDESAVEFLEGLEVPAYKIASFENTHLPLLRAVAATGKPLIISTGMATLGELEEAVETVRAAGCRDLCLLKCTSTYPATPGNSNILTIAELKKKFGCEVGLSDHTMGLGVAVASVALGATVIEKHLTLRRSDGGVDSTFSMEPDELRALVVETRNAWQSLGKVTFGPTQAEVASVAFRRSLYIAKDLKAGDVLTKDNMKCVRPAMGLSPRHYDAVLGRRLKQDAKKGTRLDWTLLD
jgi:pseudaminic acid synthase